MSKESIKRKISINNGRAFFSGQRAGDAVQLAHGVSAKDGPLLIGRGA